MLRVPQAPNGLWSTFGRDSWEQRPGVFPSVFEHAIMSVDEAFACLVRASDEFRKSAPPNFGDVLLRFFIDGGRIQSNLREYLPHADDRSLHGYVARLNQQLDGREFALALNHVQRFDRSIPLRSRRSKASLLRSPTALGRRR
jgi:hypothetical protein